MSSVQVVPEPMLLQQHVDRAAAWWEAVALAYGGCLFRQPVPVEVVLQRTYLMMKTFDTYLLGFLPFCARHPYVYRGCHCHLAGPHAIANHQVVRSLIMAAAITLRGEMARWPELGRLRQPDDGRWRVDVPWVTGRPVDTHLDLFGPGGVFHPAGVLPCSVVCQGRE